MMFDNLNEMRESNRRRQNQQATSPSVRLPLQAAFKYQALASGVVANRLQTELQKVSFDGTSLDGMGVDGTLGPKPQIELAGRKVTIRGVAQSEHQRRLIGQLVALEPGVSQVENLMKVATP